MRAINKILIISVSSFFVFLCGCSDTTEVRDRAFVHSLALEQEEDVKATLSLYGEKNVVYAGNGETVFEAISNAKATQDKSLFVGHIELLVLKNIDIKNTLEIFTSENNVSPSCSVICCDSDTSELFLDNNSEKLLKQLETKEKGGKIVQKSIYGALDQLLGKCGTAAVPVLKQNGTGMAVIGETGVMAELDDDEASGLCFIQGNIREMTLPVYCDGKTYNLFISSSSAKLNSDISDTGTKITVSVSVSAKAAENKYDKTALSSAAEEQIEELCRKTMTKTAFQLGADVVGIEKCMRKADPNSIPETRDEFSRLIRNIEFEYNVKIKM